MMAVSLQLVSTVSVVLAAVREMNADMPEVQVKWLGSMHAGSVTPSLDWQGCCIE